MFNKSFKVILLIMFSLYAALFTGCLLGDDIDTIRENAGVKEPQTVGGGSGGNGTENNPFILTNNVWKDGSITSTSSTAAVWYSFSVNAGTTYYIWWNDYDGPGNYNFDIVLNISYNNAPLVNNYGNEDFDIGYNNPKYYTPSSYGTIKIKVKPFTPGETGTFSIVYNTSGTRP